MPVRFRPLVPITMDAILKTLEENWQTVLEESLSNIHRRRDFPQADDVYFSGWKFIPFRQEDREFESSKRKLPHTWNMLKDLKHVTRCAILSLEPGGVLDIHKGPHGDEGLVWRGHLALQTNPDAYMIIGNERKNWVPGQWLFFDDEVEHGAYNYGKELRIILGLSFLKSHWKLTDQGIEYK